MPSIPWWVFLQDLPLRIPDVTSDQRGRLEQGRLIPSGEESG